jgi:hypothetical protein
LRDPCEGVDPALDIKAGRRNVSEGHYPPVGRAFRHRDTSVREGDIQSPVFVVRVLTQDSDRFNRDRMVAVVDHVENEGLARRPVGLDMDDFGTAPNPNLQAPTINKPDRSNDDADDCRDNQEVSQGVDERHGKMLPC